MDIKDLQRHWDEFGKTDPLWAILAWHKKTDPDQQWQLDEFFRLGEEEADAVVEYIKSLEVTLYWGRALDFGCGIGRVTQPLCRHYEEVVGVDIAPSMLKLAEEHNQYRGRCRYDLAVFGDNHFDFIYSSIVLQHMEPRYAIAYLKEFIRTLRPDGLLIFQVPSRPNYRKPRRFIKALTPRFIFRAYRKTRDRIDKDQPRMEMYSIKRKKVVQLLESSGAKVIDVQQDSSAGDQWISFKYCAAKRPT
jgi:SAM-dependent methyltransferase